MEVPFKPRFGRSAYEHECRDPEFPRPHYEIVPECLTAWRVGDPYPGCVEEDYPEEYHA